MKQLLDTMKEKGIAQVKLLVIDINGHPKFMIIPRDQLEKAVNGVGIDGSSIPGFTTVNNSDLIAKPDLESVVFLEDEAAIFCDVEYEDGQLFEGDPRRILKNVLKKGKFLVKPELEFFFLRKGVPLDTYGYMEPGEGLNIVEDAIYSVDTDIERIHHENGAGQYEIEPVMAPALKACDNVIILKDVLKQKARLNQVTATFMPKPFLNEAGNGMHLHMVLEKNGENLFDGFTEFALHFIGGLLSHAKGITAICNPIINSYKRLVPHFEAPVYITWGRGNRSALVRIPRGGASRIEYRAPDPSCNPYLALAVIVGAGLDGIEKKIEPPEEITENIFESKKTTFDILPSTLGEALLELEKDELVKEILGKYMVEEFIKLKKEEIQTYNTHISQWELDHYMDS